MVIRTAYSSVNYKDALAATTGRFIRAFPRIGGIDAAGTVVSSTDPRFKPGDQVIATSYEIGVGNECAGHHSAGEPDCSFAVRAGRGEA